MIDIRKAKPGFSVYYQQPYMHSPEYGVITSTNPEFVFVRFTGDMHSKACRPDDLHWPPDFCAIDGCNPEGQPFSTLEPR